ncbi:hypothetical protein BGZ61DRAFT_531207 [Ilyonectria robusta]|uniref:uncharacterized protein n=1 Tax=Ilyonectria robusta TaxID=1079257 RepID=UPI001E8DFE61|nr:uncharacterized protein BGZ61DRAFT_531207 [Ilyonectria robusta]KAH8714599.1 hypothetical protein BGZ61DRAFT_531207 [Ilyonectria robusta]
MVIGLLTIASIPTVIGVAEAISAQKSQNASLSKEQEKFHLAPLMRRKGKSEEAGVGVLVDNKLFLNLPERPVEGHEFNGYYFKYPSEEGHLGMVSTIAVDPPMLNWIYIHRDTHAVEYGGRKETVGHVIGPWGWSDDERFLTLQGDHDAFVAVREEADDGRWAVYWDPEGEIQETAGKRCRPVALCRKLQRGVESRFVRD